MNIAILGAGPAAMIAGWACERNGHEPVFHARAEKSAIQPGMYLQRPLPGLHELGSYDATISYERRGTPETYAAKVYGDPKAEVSWEHVAWGADRPLWWLSSVYDKLWERYAGHMVDYELTSESVVGIKGMFHLVINTIPAPAICALPGVCHFGQRRIKLLRAAVEDNIEEARKVGPLHRNVMLYNGLDTMRWFRYTRIEGFDIWEYPHDYDPPTRGIKEVQILDGIKPVSNTCECHPTIARVGRWAQWERGVLNHHTFERTQGILASAGLGKEY